MTGAGTRWGRFDLVLSWSSPCVGQGSITAVERFEKTLLIAYVEPAGAAGADPTESLPGPSGGFSHVVVPADSSFAHWLVERQIAVLLEGRFPTYPEEVPRGQGRKRCWLAGPPAGGVSGTGGRLTCRRC